MLDKQDKSPSGSGETWNDLSSMSFASHEFVSPWGENEEHPESFLMTTLNSFKRDPARSISRRDTWGADGRVFDAQKAARATAESPLVRRLKGRHLQMIAFGGSIGKDNLAYVCNISD
ncbi:MAG: hypothetical protein LQ340_002260 [Diploschistes diacapsis]|nr:MAG: hypothetical protein LQ340_002260 [Diploschistes diacapsis]